jgi:hypothetical protein
MKKNWQNTASKLQDVLDIAKKFKIYLNLFIGVLL